MVLLRWVHWICKLACLNGMKRMFGVMNGPLLTPCTSFMQWALASTQNSPHVIQFSGKSTHWKKREPILWRHICYSCSRSVGSAQHSNGLQMTYAQTKMKENWSRSASTVERNKELRMRVCLFADFRMHWNKKRWNVCVCVGNEIMKKKRRKPLSQDVKTNIKKNCTRFHWNDTSDHWINTAR